MVRTEVILYLGRRYRFILDYLFDDRKFLHYPRSREAGICQSHLAKVLFLRLSQPLHVVGFIAWAYFTWSCEVA